MRGDDDPHRPSQPEKEPLDFVLLARPCRLLKNSTAPHSTAPRGFWGWGWDWAVTTPTSKPRCNPICVYQKERRPVAFCQLYAALRPQRRLVLCLVVRLGRTRNSEWT